MSEESKKILVMDDEEIVGDIAKQMLMYMGYEVLVVREGKEAVGAYKDAYDKGTPFIAAIMDLNIPQGMGGLEAAKEVLLIDAGARILVSSGNPNDPIMEEHQKHGFCGSIAKPFDLKGLEDSVKIAVQ